MRQAILDTAAAMGCPAINFWSPDHCGCKNHTLYDHSLIRSSAHSAASRDAVPALTYVTGEEAKAIHQSRIDRGLPHTNPNAQPEDVLCPDHETLERVSRTGTTPLYEAVLEENQRKNRALQAVISSDPTLGTPPDENGVVTPAPEKVAYTFDSNRILHLIPNSSRTGESLRLELFGRDSVALVEPDIVQLQASLDTAVGPGKAVID